MLVVNATDVFFFAPSSLSSSSPLFFSLTLPVLLTKKTINRQATPKAHIHACLRFITRGIVLLLIQWVTSFRRRLRLLLVVKKREGKRTLIETETEREKKICVVIFLLIHRRHCFDDGGEWERHGQPRALYKNAVNGLVRLWIGFSRPRHSFARRLDSFYLDFFSSADVCIRSISASDLRCHNAVRPVLSSVDGQLSTFRWWTSRRLRTSCQPLRK